MGSQTGTSNDRLRMNWTPTMERYFLDLMLEHSRLGNRVGHTFNKLAWNDMHTKFNSEFAYQYDRDVLKNRYATLWKQFNDVKYILCQIGFSWDASRNMVIADDFTWDAYIKVHPDARCYRTKSVQNFDDLCVIYGSTFADGRYSLSSHDARLDNEAQTLQLGDQLGSAAPSSNDHPKSNWTAAMDQFFIELLVDQLSRGNKVDNLFTKKAWTDMLVIFNTKFGSQHGQRFLKKRYEKLLKYYCDITVLVKEGFSWDEKEQMLAADDSVWNTYVKVHPHARVYRMKTFPNYHDLELLFRNESDDVKSNLDQEKNLKDVMHEINPGGGRRNRNTSGTDRTKTHWKSPMDRCFIDLMVEQVKKGSKLGQTFTTPAWNDMVTVFNRIFKSHHDKDVLKNRFKHFRRQYKDIDKLLQQNGFSWDDTREMVAAEDSKWDAYTEVHPEARSLRAKTLLGYRKLCVIFGEECIDKRYSLLASITDPGGELSTSMAGEGKNGSFLSVYGAASTIVWTECMKCCFIDLVIEQVNQGNRVENTFNQQAWTHMITAFNGKFGLQCDKQFLEDQYFCIMKQYEDISSLLNHDGFAWDETLQMVIAENDVWEAYIKDHPDAILYRDRFLYLYPDFCKIFGNKVSNSKITTQGEIQCMEADHTTIEMDIDRDSGHSLLMGNTEISGPGIKRLETGMDGTSGNLVVTANASLYKRLDGPSRHAVVTGNTETSSLDKNILKKFNQDKTNKKLVATSSMEIKGCGKKRGGEMPSNSRPLSKKTKNYQRIRKELSDKANAVKKLMKRKDESNGGCFQNALSALQAMPDIDDELVMDACDLLEDEKKAQIFLALNMSLRKKWLLRKLRSQ